MLPRKAGRVVGRIIVVEAEGRGVEYGLRSGIYGPECEPVAGLPAPPRRPHPVRCGLWIGSGCRVAVPSRLPPRCVRMPEGFRHPRFFAQAAQQQHKEAGLSNVSSCTKFFYLNLCKNRVGEAGFRNKFNEQPVFHHEPAAFPAAVSADCPQKGPPTSVCRRAFSRFSGWIFGLDSIPNSVAVVRFPRMNGCVPELSGRQGPDPIRRL